MARFILTIDTGSDAFHDSDRTGLMLTDETANAELARILHDLASDKWLLNTEQPVHDINGNRVGTARYIRDDDA